MSNEVVSAITAHFLVVWKPAKAQYVKDSFFNTKNVLATWLLGALDAHSSIIFYLFLVLFSEQRQEWSDEINALNPKIAALSKDIKRVQKQVQS